MTTAAVRTTNLGWYKDVSLPWEQAIERVKAELAEVKFGVLTEIRVHEKLQEKLGVTDFPRYIVLGACNPALANQALRQNRDVGLLVPCNVTVEEIPGGSRIGIVQPEELMRRFEEDTVICSLAEAAGEKLKGVIDRL